MAWDIDLFYFLNNLAGKSPLFDALTVFLASYLQYLLGIVFLVFVFCSRSVSLDKFRVFIAGILAAIIARLGVTNLIRFLYHRPRPFMALSARQLIPENDWSFPSGHSSFFFALAFIVFLYDRKWGTGFLAAALLMNVSRVVAGVHYPTDIIGGAVVGVVVAYAVFHLINKRVIRRATS